MTNQEIENLVSAMRTKLNDENMALISEEITAIITDTANMNTQIENKDSEINNLKQTKDNLIQTNGNLLTQISFQQQNLKTNKNPENEEDNHYSLSNSFDEKGNFI